MRTFSEITKQVSIVDVGFRPFLRRFQPRLFSLPFVVSAVAIILFVAFLFWLFDLLGIQPS